MVEVEVTDFPRGGASILTPLETRKLKESAKKDVLFGNNEIEEPVKKKKKKDKDAKKNETKNKETSLKKTAVSHFTYKYLIKDMLVLGYVKEIYKSDIVIGLSNGLSGYMNMSSLQSWISKHAQDDNDDSDNEDDDEISACDLFSIGQLIPATVKELFPGKTGYQKISLSVLPDDVNVAMTKSCLVPKMLVWGRIDSIEDHGCTVSFGKDKISGFLPKKKDEKSGMIKWFCVEKVSDNKKIVTLSIDWTTISKALVSSSKLHFNSLFPGQLVKMTVTEASEDGLSGQVGGSFDAVVESLHVLSHGDPDSLSKKTVNGRILHINPKTKQIGISLVPDLVGFSENMITNKYKIGDIIEDCEVLKFESSHGLLMEMPNEQFGVVHISRISDERTEKVGKKHKNGTMHNCRVLGFSALESAYTLTMKKSDLEKSFLRYDDLKGGMKVAGEVISLEDFGCLIKITNHIRGLCPKLHLADINLTQPEKKFVEGKKLKFRVLYSKPESNKLILTHKKTLMKSKLPMVLSINEIKIGETVHGFISKIKDFGMFVSFYNEIRALLPKSQVNIPPNSTLEEAYKVGQVIQCKILSVNKEEKKLVVTLKESIDEPSKGRLTKGEIVSGKLQKVDPVDDKKSLNLIVNGCECVLPVHHYSDFKHLNEQWKVLVDSLCKDFSINESIVFGYNKKARQTIVSQKQVLLKSGCKIDKFGDLKVGMVCAGVVSHIMSYGVFVEVAPNVTGLIPISVLADGFVKTIEDSYYIGQSLIVSVSEIDEEKNRFLISSKPSLIKEETELNESFSGSSLVTNYLIQRFQLFKDALGCDTAIKELPSLIGEIIVTEVKKVENDGVTLSYKLGENVVEGFIPAMLRYGAEFEIGNECQCYVFSIDFAKGKFLATSHKDAIDAIIKSSEDEEETEIKFPEGKKITATIMDINEHVVTCILPDYHFILAYMPSSRHINEKSDVVKRLTLSQNIFVKFNCASGGSGVIVDSIDDMDKSEVTLGTSLTAVIKGIKPMQLSVSLLNGKLLGCVHISNITDQFEDGKSILGDFKPLQLIDVKVIGFREMKTQTTLAITKSTAKTIVDLSMKPSVLASEENTFDELREVKDGEKVQCFVTSVTKRFIWVSISPTIKGKISNLHFTTNEKDLKRLSSVVKPGFGYEALVLGQDEEHNCKELSRIGDPSKLITKGSVLTGRVSKIMGHGLLLELPNHKAGVVNITELHDEFINDPLEGFAVNQFYKCKVLNIGKGDKIDLSLRNSRITDTEPDFEGYDRSIDGFDDLKEGDILRGYVKSCSKVGVFVSLSQSIVGRVQIKNLSQFFVKNYIDMFPVGRLVKAKILKIDPSNNYIDLSLRGKDVGGPDLCPAPKRKATEDEENKNEDEEGSPMKKRKLIEEVEDSDSESEDSDSGMESAHEEGDEDDSDEEEAGEKPGLQLSQPFDWNAEVQQEALKDDSDDSDDGSDDEDEAKKATKKSKRQKKAAKKAEEEYLHKTEMALLDTKAQLESAEDFDRMILGSPNSSLVWIQYMAFHLHSAEVEKARAVGEKALKTIAYREEGEKFNVWVAMLNLENMYGTTESLDKCFQNALRVNEPKKVYFKMVDIYVKDEKNEEADKMYQTMARKFRTSSKVWTAYGQFLMKTNQLDAARKLLQRSLKSLPQRKHIANIVKFAVMEYKMGEKNRGSTIFESVLKNYPKRTDLWSIYIDMNIKEGEIEQVRNIFERVTALTMNSKKMKFLFKRYMNFEEQYGNKTTVEGVRQKALNYVDNAITEE